MQITWYGHSCFLLENDAGIRILTDPCDPDTGYALPSIPADIVTISHNHSDHNCVSVASGEPAVISDPGVHAAHGISVTGFPAWHDDANGRKRGANILYRFELDGVRVLHLGDLGHALDRSFAESIGRVDVLLCPIGGVFTIDAAQAAAVANLLEPRVFIPMHYATPQLRFDVGGLDALLRQVKTYSVHRLNSSTCSLSPETLGERRVLILDYAIGQPGSESLRRP